MRSIAVAILVALIAVGAAHGRASAVGLTFVVNKTADATANSAGHTSELSANITVVPIP